MNSSNIDVEKYLQNRGVKIIKKEGSEFIVRCLFSDCDQDSSGTEAHLYIQKETGLYHCKKCGAKGNLSTLQKHFGDFTPVIKSQEKTKRNFSQSLVEDCENNLSDEFRKYLNDRGVSNEVITNRRIGQGNFFYTECITFPITLDGDVEPSFFYIRKDPKNINEKLPKNWFFPKKVGEEKRATLYGEYADVNQDLIICEGIMDCLSLLSLGVKALTSLTGCATFRDEWIDDRLLKAKRIFVAYDNDEAGRKGADKVLKLLKQGGHKEIYRVTLPKVVGDKGDINDYLAKHKLPVADLFTIYAERYPKPVDISKFKEITLEDLDEILELTIKGDKANKLITFLAQLSAFTENNQFNIMYNAPSSAGKSYIALQCSKLFPSEDLIILGNCSATAFFHESGKYSIERNTIVVDLSRKVLLFTENQHYQLLEKLRGFLSHDEKVMNIKTTDKNQKGGHKTKNVELVGYASVIFCTANLRSDDQEKTRFLILSPEISDSKIKAGIKKVIERETGSTKFEEMLSSHPDRQLLRERIVAIRDFEVQDIIMSKENAQYLEEKFFEQISHLQPRHQRDIKRLIDVAKSISLLNLWFRNPTDHTITIDRTDIDKAIELYLPISITQSLGVSPFLYSFYKDIIEKLFWQKNNHNVQALYENLSYQDIINFHFKEKNRKLDYNYLRQQILPELEACGLIEKIQEGTKVTIKITDLGSENQSCESVGGVIPTKS
jgi:5S rRNA maturation endonuclease (ribonuclease M5)